MQDYQILLDAVRQNFADVASRYRVHEKQADICAERYKRIETINIFVAILTFCGVLFLIIEPDKNYLWIKIATSILTVIMVAIAAYFKSSDLKILEKQHRETAGKFLAFKNHLEQIIADIHIRRRAILDIEIEYKRMMECLNKLYATVPVAYDKVLEKRYGICNGEKRSIYTEAEIDALLPPALKGQVEN